VIVTEIVGTEIVTDGVGAPILGRVSGTGVTRRTVDVGVMTIGIGTGTGIGIGIEKEIGIVIGKGIEIGPVVTGTEIGKDLVDD